MTKILRMLDYLEKENKELKSRVAELERKQDQNEEKIRNKMMAILKKEDDSYMLIN